MVCMKWIILALVLWLLFGNSSTHLHQFSWSYSGIDILGAAFGIVAAAIGVVLSVFLSFGLLALTLVGLAILGLGLPLAIVALVLLVVIGPLVLPLILLMAIVGMVARAGCEVFA